MSSTIRRATPKMVLVYAEQDDPRVVAKVVQLLQRLMLTPLEANDACTDEKRPPAKRRRGTGWPAERPIAATGEGHVGPTGRSPCATPIAVLFINLVQKAIVVPVCGLDPASSRPSSGPQRGGFLAESSQSTLGTGRDPPRADATGGHAQHRGGPPCPPLSACGVGARGGHFAAAAGCGTRSHNRSVL
jgi:hypothetical protein